MIGTHYSTLVQRCRSTNSLLADELNAEFRRLENKAEGWHENFQALERVLVGATGLSAIEEAQKLRKLHPLETQK